MDYLEYAYLQIAQDGPAREVLDELIGFRQNAGANLAGAYAVAAIPVRYALERRLTGRRCFERAGDRFSPLSAFPGRKR